jgi:hypothetical protein
MTQLDSADDMKLYSGKDRQHTAQHATIMYIVDNY